MAPPWKLTAQEEIEKDPKLKNEDVKYIRNWISTQDHLPAISDEMILHFIHACYYNVEQTKITLECFYTYKNSMPEFFENWDPFDPEMQATLNEVLIAAPLPHCNSQGQRILLSKLNSIDSKKFNFALCIKWLLMSCLHALWTEGAQKGYVIVYDAAGFSFSHMLKCTLSSAKNYINFGKNASPMRVQQIVFINTSSVVEKVLALVRPFLSKELINMMKFYRTPEGYFQTLEPENIPEDYGGKAPNLLWLHNKYVKEICESREWLMKEEKIKADKNKCGKNKKEVQKMEKSFSKLELD